MPDSVSIDAPAKVNLRLSILAREASGYHSLESLFCALSLADRVTVRRASAGVALRVDGDVDTGPPERNLAVRAARAFHAALGTEPAVEIELAKLIPSAAGLGGGSSDAAATLIALNALHGEPLGNDLLLQLGIELGSDVPFFLCGSPLALGWGRGERLLALARLPTRPVLVAHPGVAMPTAEAFAHVAEERGPSPTPRAFRIHAADLAEWASVARLAENDFEPPVIARIPVLREALAAMKGAGAEVALLAGSGSSVFGVFRENAARDAAGGAVEALGLATWSAATLESMPAARVDPGG
ncbi:MAG TPA: 4-(cytidine 5'-diphospho)-2-C-methyl-D-erythritol kinase [Longimicrobium sp.]|nr:4-(cytidine 5'-diphospho)-2-C-methyl-D-erythritol kinase [Longimicrobium sp.]